MIEETVENWIATVALRRVAVFLGKCAVTLVTGAVAQAYLTKYGVQVDPVKLQLETTTAVGALIEAGHDWLKLKGVVKF